MDCKNCQKTLLKSQKYCDKCGAKVIQNRLTLKILFNQINQEFLSADNKLLKTFIFLFTKPEKVINGYINGTRKKYINVIQYFAIALTFTGIQVFFMDKIFNNPELYKTAFLEELSKTSGQKNNPFFNQTNNDFNSLNSLIFTLSVPISAFGTWLSYKIIGLKVYNFTEHIIINIYYGAQAMMVSAVVYIILLGLGINFFTIAFIVTILTYIYFFYVLKRVFNTKFWLTAGSFVLSLFFLLIFFLLISGIITITIVFFMIIFK